MMYHDVISIKRDTRWLANYITGARQKSYHSQGTSDDKVSEALNKIFSPVPFIFVKFIKVSYPLARKKLHRVCLTAHAVKRDVLV